MRGQPFNQASGEGRDGGGNIGTSAIGALPVTIGPMGLVEVGAGAGAGTDR